jgi:hypothetical protein
MELTKISSLPSENFTINNNSACISGQYAILGGDEGVYYSSDNGVNFVLTDLTDVIKHVYMKSNTNFIAVGDNGLWYSFNGQTWSKNYPYHLKHPV